MLLISIACLNGACGSTAATGGHAAPANASSTAVVANTGSNVVACKTLSNEEISAVQGEAVRETKGNDSMSGGLAISHCVYLLPTYSKSLSLDIMRAGPSNAGSGALEKFWETRFEDGEKEREREREKARTASGKDREREKEEMESKPRPVPGVGDEAFWVGSGVKGSLYVRKDDAVLILSIGGAEDESTRLKKTIQLAQHALNHIQSQVRDP